jgi:hypothetical protein
MLVSHSDESGVPFVEEDIFCPCFVDHEVSISGQGSRMGRVHCILKNFGCSYLFKYHYI